MLSIAKNKKATTMWPLTIPSEKGLLAWINPFDSPPPLRVKITTSDFFYSLENREGDIIWIDLLRHVEENHDGPVTFMVTYELPFVP